MELDQAALQRALHWARTYLRRWDDTVTHNLRDDLAQEAVIVLWQRQHGMRRPSAATAFVRTVLIRLRRRALDRSARLGSCDDLALLEVGPEPRCRECFVIAGRRVPKRVVLGELEDVLDGLSPLNRVLIRGYYGGATSRELGRRFGVPVGGVRARIYRSRQWIREEFEARVRSRVPRLSPGERR